MHKALEAAAWLSGSSGGALSPEPRRGSYEPRASTETLGRRSPSRAERSAPGAGTPVPRLRLILFMPYESCLYKPMPFLCWDRISTFT